MTFSQDDLPFLRRCIEAKAKSHDPNRKVGAVIVDPNGKIIGVGSNAPPVSLRMSPFESHLAIEDDPRWKYHMLEHAERNAIYAALHKGHSLANATMYGTLYPCADCARAICAAGISRLVVPCPGGDTARDQKWLDHYTYASRIFELAGVQVDIVNLDILNK
jgi:dCMP deaminase